MKRSSRVKNLLAKFVGTIINYFSNASEISQWVTPNYSRPEPATGNVDRDGRYK